MSINSLLTKSLSSKQMTKQVAIELLKQGNTGNDIIAILDALTPEGISASAEEDSKGEMVDFEGNPTTL